MFLICADQNTLENIKMNIYIVNRSSSYARLTKNMFQRMGFSNIMVVPNYRVLTCFVYTPNSIIVCEDPMKSSDLEIMKSTLNHNVCIILTKPVESHQGLELYTTFDNLVYLMCPFSYHSLYYCVKTYINKQKRKN